MIANPFYPRYRTFSTSPTRNPGELPSSRLRIIYGANLGITFIFSLCSYILCFTDVLPYSFTSTISVILNTLNGVITVPEGTPLNYKADDSEEYNAFRIITNYIYRVSGKPGDDTTLGSGRITIHYQRGIYATDQFDTTQIYPLNATLYIGLDGKLTSKQPTEDHPGVAICTGPPSAATGTLEFMLL